MLSYTAGDLDRLAATSSVRIGGLQVARNFATRPDLITYPCRGSPASRRAEQRRSVHQQL